MRLWIMSLFVLIGITGPVNAVPVFTEAGYNASAVGSGMSNGYGTAVTTTGEVYFTSGSGA